MTTFTVTNLADAGVGSLRQAIVDANSNAGPDTVVFQTGLTGTVRLTTTGLVLAQDVTIIGDTNGDGKADITISGDKDNTGTTTGGDVRVIQSSGANVVLKSLNLTRGYAAGGGGILVDGGSLTLQDSSVTYSKASSGNVGGGIEVLAGAHLTVLRSTISHNNGSQGGGMAVYGTADIMNSALIANGGGSRGGGLFVSTASASATLVNTTISGNIASNGGGAFVKDGATLELLSSTMTKNTASGAYGITAYQSTLTITNSVVADNWGHEDLRDSGGSTITVNNSFLNIVNGTIDSGANNIITGASPMLGALADNGGPVQTHAILAGSPLLGAGDASLLPNDTFDLDGDGRIANEDLSRDATGSARVNGLLDIGAVEADFDLIVTTANDEVVEGGHTLAQDQADGGGLSLREAIFHAATGAKIGFSGAMTLRLTQELTLSKSVTINGDVNGDDKSDVTISGDNDSNGRDTGDVRIFNVQSGTIATLESITLTDGYAAGGGSKGGAIFATANTYVAMTNVSVLNSWAALNGAGGGIYSAGGLVAANSVFAGNQAGSGGAIYMHSGDAALLNSTITQNTALNSGGGISTFAGADIHLYGSTLVGNSAINGGAIELWTNSDLTMVNTVIAGNTSNNLSTNDIYESGTNTHIDAEHSFLGNNIVLDTDDGHNKRGSNPGLAALADNGGTVKTMAILDGSLLIDAGDNAFDSVGQDIFDLDHDGNKDENTPIDGRGAQRVVNGAVDIGAFETLATNDTNVGDPVVENTDGSATGNVITNDASGIVLSARVGAESAGGAFQSGAITGTYGSLTIAANGSWTYTLTNADPDTNALASGQVVHEFFTYRASFSGIIDTAQIDITITGANDAPTAGDDSRTINEDAIGDFSTLLSNDTDPDTGSTKTIVSVGNGVNGTPSLQSDGRVLFTPTADFNGTATFTYTMRDDFNAQSTATVTVTVNPINDAPQISSNGAGATAIVSIAENSTFVTTVMSNDPDSGATHTYSIVDGDDGGAGFFQIDPNTGVLSFVNAPNFERAFDVGSNNVYDVTVSVSDGTLTDEQAIAVTVTNIPGHTIKGSNSATKGDKIDGTHGPSSNFATNEEDKINGRAGNDTIKALGDDDTVRGGAGRDQLDGGTGYDTLDFSDMKKSVVLTLKVGKFANATVGGVADDKVKNFEAVIGGKGGDKLTGDGMLNQMFGKDGNDTLNGGKNSDQLDGGKGNDTLTGGKTDADSFIFSTKLGLTNVDTITDFKHGLDKLALDDAIFAAIGPTIEAGEVLAKAGATKAKQLDDRLIYDTKTGWLYYDADGSLAHGKAAIHFATLRDGIKPAIFAFDDAFIV